MSSRSRGGSGGSTAPVPFEGFPAYLRKNITLPMLALIFAMAFLSYSQITEVGFTQAVFFVEKTVASIPLFSSWVSRDPTTSQLFGQTFLETSTAHKIQFGVTWATFAMIGIGIMGMAYKYREMLTVPGQGHRKSEFLARKFEVEYLAVAMACSLLLVLIVVAPYVSIGYEYTRLYSLTLTVLAPCFILGAAMVARAVRLRTLWVVLAVVLSWFAFSTGLVDQVTYHSPYDRSSILNPVETTAQNTSYVLEQDSVAPRWLAEYMNRENKILLYSYTREVVQCQGELSTYQMTFFAETMTNGSESYYVYLRDRDVIAYDRFGGDRKFVLEEHPEVLAGSIMIYANGGSEVFYR